MGSSPGSGALGPQSNGTISAAVHRTVVVCAARPLVHILAQRFRVSAPCGRAASARTWVFRHCDGPGAASPLSLRLICLKVEAFGAGISSFCFCLISSHAWSIASRSPGSVCTAARAMISSLVCLSGGGLGFCSRWITACLMQQESILKAALRWAPSSVSLVAKASCCRCAGASSCSTSSTM